ncbi:MAG TPA: pyridoxal phosphate-dependent aminotransferase, partial [Longimicrobium sp.]|nr:pyridoxal phosphate-dependent aminotransferase [Longimicrobium sp.]
GRMWPYALVAGSLSKSNALTGLRLGWLVGDPKAIAAATKVHQLVNTAASTFSQTVAREVFAAGADSLGAHRAHYAERLELVAGLMKRNGIGWVRPEGAFYCMVRLPMALEHDSLAAAEALLEAHHVVATPGRAFGDSGEGWLRLSWVAEPDDLRAATERIAAFFATAERA